MLFPRSTATVCLLACLISSAAFAQGLPVPLADRTRGSERVVVGRVTSVSPVWQTNQFGDRLIVSIVSVAVDETLRGPVQQTVDVEIEDDVKKTTRLLLLAMAAAIGLVPANDTSAYVTDGITWSQLPVPYVINTTNLDLPESVEPAMRAGADVWANQSAAAVSLSYAGRSAQTTTGYDGLNLVVFRNASNGSAIATTYYWSSANRIIDADIVFWDAAFQFFAGTTGCAGGFYIEDIAAHEFGHALGMGHSALQAATMYPSTSSCNVNNRSLDADAIAGILFLYPPSPGVPQQITNVRVVGG
jgi:Matrixin